MNTGNGNSFDPQAYELAHSRMLCAPLDLTERDFRALESVHPGLVTQALQLRRIAQADAQRTKSTTMLGSAPLPSLPAISDPTAAIEALDRKVGRVQTLDDVHLACEKSQRAPEAVTDDDITLIRFFHGENAAARARERRAKALAPPPRATVPTLASRATPRVKVWQKYPTPEAYQKAFDEAYERFKRDVQTVTKDDAQLLNQKVQAWELHSLRKFVLSINDKNKVRDARLDALESAQLETRVKALESRPELHYAGVWKSGERYSEGALLTHAGSLWLATETTNGTPGTAASGFRLIAKGGAR